MISYADFLLLNLMNIVLLLRNKKKIKVPTGHYSPKIKTLERKLHILTLCRAIYEAHFYDVKENIECKHA